MAFDPRGEMLASGSYDGTVKLRDARNGELLRELEEHRQPVSDARSRKLQQRKPVLSVAFDASGKMLASGSEDKRVRLWEPCSGKLALRAQWAPAAGL